MELSAIFVVGSPDEDNFVLRGAFSSAAHFFESLLYAKFF